MSRWLLAACLVVSGCAYGLEAPDPNRPRNKLPDCSTSKGLVALDGLMATAMGVTTLALMAEDEPGVALLPLAIGALYVGGAVSGNRAVDKCRAALGEYERGYGGGVADNDDDRDDSGRDEFAPSGRDEREEDEEAQRRARRRRPAPPEQRDLDPRLPPNPPIASAPPAAQPQSPYPQPQSPYPEPQQPYPQQPSQAQPPAQQQPAPPAGKPKTKRPRKVEADEDDWSDFWKEVQ